MRREQQNEPKDAKATTSDLSDVLATLVATYGWGLVYQCLLTLSPSPEDFGDGNWPDDASQAGKLH